MASRYAKIQMSGFHNMGVKGSRGEASSEESKNQMPVNIL